MSVVKVIRGGLSTTVQDLGRPYLRHLGIPVCGAMDRISHELANRLVGNAPDCATLEMTLSGDELEWSADGLIAISGADLLPIVSSPDHHGTPVPQHTPVRVRAGTRVKFQTSRRGCRCYLAVAGGFDVPIVMGSRATYLRAGIGGLNGRILKTDDELPIGGTMLTCEMSNNCPVAAPLWFVRPLNLPPPSAVLLRALTGTHHDRMSDESQSALWNTDFQLSSQSDRMGYRLSGTRLNQHNTDELLSEGTVIGTVQLPPDGNPILLMADSAPTGGYPRIAQVITADLPLAAQVCPGQSIRFLKTTIEEARELLRRQRDDLDRSILMAGASNVGKMAMRHNF